VRRREEERGWIGLLGWGREREWVLRQQRKHCGVGQGTSYTLPGWRRREREREREKEWEIAAMNSWE
jgi:hypothetical protein